MDASTALVIVAGINGGFALLIARAGHHAKRGRRAAEHADRAVNSRPEGDPTLYELAASAERLAFGTQSMAREAAERLGHIEWRVAGIEQRVARIEEGKHP